MPSWRVVVIGDSQVKFMCRSRLPLKASVKTSTLSFAGYDAVRTAEAASAMHFQRVNFAILYIEGNDLVNFNAEPQEICNNIGKLVLQLQHDVAPNVCLQGAPTPLQPRRRRCGAQQKLSALAEPQAGGYAKALATCSHLERRGKFAPA
ncbi:hypothetical protein MRX96_020449 [Rhipicephalus microplus]